MAVVLPNVVGVVRVVVPEDLFVGRTEVLKAVRQSLRELFACRDISGERFPSVAFRKFVVVHEDSRRRHPVTCVVHMGQRAGG
jgi:hypothetical protein